MSRFLPVIFDDLSPEQKRLHGEIGGPRDGQVGGPYSVWLQANPELTQRMIKVGEALRFQGKLDKRLLEIVVLCVARYWRCGYQWAAHVPLALRFGVSQTVIDAIGMADAFECARHDEQLVAAATSALLVEKQLDQAVYDRLLTTFEFEEVVELITLVGQYSMAAIVMNGFEIEALDGSRPFA